MRLTSIRKIMLGLLVLFTVQNATSATKVVTARKAVGKGYVYSWYQYLRNPHRPRVFGLSITASAAEGLGGDQMLEFSLEPDAKHQIPPFKHFTIDWNPHGHDPIEIYGVPHFDFHFYTISHTERHQITCMGSDAAVCTKAPAADLIPQDYVPTPGGVPMMGWHWVDPTSSEFHGFPFTATFVFGYYNGNQIFWEPMVALSFLESHPTKTYEIKQPDKVSSKGWYPMKYIVRYNSPIDTYDVMLTDLYYVGN